MTDNVVSLNPNKIKISNKELMDQLFFRAVVTLGQKELPIKTAYKFQKITKELEPLRVEAMQLTDKLKKQYLELDPSGALVPETNEEGNAIPGKYKMLEGKSQEEFESEFKDLADIEHETNLNKVNISELEGHVAFSAQDISVLTPLLCGFED